MGILKKSYQLVDSFLDEKLQKANGTAQQQPAYDRRAMMEVDYGTEQQWGWREKRGLVGSGVLKNMARKDSIVGAIIQTRQNQVARFAHPQPDRYSPGYKIVARKPADLSREDKLKLADPELSEEEYEKLKHDMEKKRSKLQEEQEKEIEEIQNFIEHCGIPSESDDDELRCDFERFIRLIVWDRLVYNYVAIELIPNKLYTGLHHFYPVSSGGIRYVTRKSARGYQNLIKEIIRRRADPNRAGVRVRREIKDAYQQQLQLKDGSNSNNPNYDDSETDKKKLFKYVQVVRGRIEAAWANDELIFEAGNPTVDPEDLGYAPGELELLIKIVTAHLYAEAHNRNHFSQGVGSKGILHIKGENLSRAQLEGFRRQWFNQVVNARNSFRPPVIGMADEVKWVSLSQSNRDMEFDSWMHYLIKITCAHYQIDPAEINFDISKTSTSTLNESSSDSRIKYSKDKGLGPLLNFIQRIVNRKIIRRWKPEYFEKYEFRFVGLEAETKKEHAERLDGETKVWKTINEARNEMGKEPIEHGDVIRDATYTQYLQMKSQAEMAEQAPPEEEEAPQDEDPGGDETDLMSELDEIDKEVEQELKDKKNSEKSDDAKKSRPFVTEYYFEDDDNE